MRILLLGSRGQLGQELSTRLSGEVLSPSRTDADLARPDEWPSLLDAWNPDVLINCAAYNLVDRAEDDPAAAFAVNAWGLRPLARWCGARDRLLVHFSTDHVFGLDRQRRFPHAENDPPGPVSVYGVSKLAGEFLVRGLCSRHLIVRTCGLYGLHGSGGKGTNFVEVMLRLAAQKKPIRVVADQVCTPTSAADLAAATVRLLEEGRTGVVHRTNQGECSWHEFAAAVFEEAGLPVVSEAITTADYGAKAQRPAYSVLASRLPPLRPWREALADYLEERRRIGRTGE